MSMIFLLHESKAKLRKSVNNKDTVGHLFSRATNFANGLKKEVQGNNFHESTLVILA